VGHRADLRAYRRQAEGERRGIWPIVGETHTGGGARR
jgi:hypothetical protein